jgi:hypothetical protein
MFVMVGKGKVIFRYGRNRKGTWYFYHGRKSRKNCYGRTRKGNFSFGIKGKVIYVMLRPRHGHFFFVIGKQKVIYVTTVGKEMAFLFRPLARSYLFM